MQIVVNEQFKDAIKWACKYVNEYSVDIDIHIDADGEMSVSVCPTYRDRNTADIPYTDCDSCAESGSYKCTKCDGEMYYKDAPHTKCDRSNTLSEIKRVPTIAIIEEYGLGGVRVETIVENGF